MTTKTEALALIEREWRAGDSLFAGLSEEQLARPVFTGEGSGWRVRDLPPHFAWWLRLAARGARRAVEIGSGPDQNTTLRRFLGIETGVDTLNADTHARWHGRPAADLFAELRSAREDLRAALAALPDDLLVNADSVETDGMHRYIWQPAVNHFRQHREHIESALKERAAT